MKKQMKKLLDFLRRDSGAISLDWVALSTGIVLLAVALVTAVGETVDFRISQISTTLSDAGNQVVDFTD